MDWFLWIIPAAFSLAIDVSDWQASGRPSVTDGDTLVLAGERVRLHGIDAPELKQICTLPDGSEWRCGLTARAVLAESIGGEVTCEAVGDKADRYGRRIALCTSGGVDLNRMMVREGLALAYRRYSDDYAADEDAARAAGKGIWGSSFTAPWDWR